MNISELHQSQKEVSAVSLFKGELGTAIAIQIERNGTLKEHITKVPALLVCVSGNAVFDNEKGEKTDLQSGDYVLIEENVKHWVNAFEDSNFLLIK